MEDPYFEDLFYSRWEQLRQNELSNGNLEYAIDSIVEYIDEAQKRNYERWPILGEYVWPNYDWEGNDYNDEVAFFESWLFNRIEWIDDNIPGFKLNPAAELSKNYPELEITLSDDYFNKPFLENEYFILNNAPPELNIESVTYLNAYRAQVNLSGNADGAGEISITLGSEILNGFNDITTNELSLGIGTPFTMPKVVLYATRNALHLECNYPEMLGDKLEIFNLSGQKIMTAKIEQNHINTIFISTKPGVYICRYLLDDKPQNRQIVFVN